MGAEQEEPTAKGAASPVGIEKDGNLLASSGDFEQGAAGWKISGNVVPDPTDAKNHVLSLLDKTIAWTSVDLAIPESIHSVRVSFRVLVPRDLEFSDGLKLLLRVRLYSEKGRFDDP